MTSVIIADVLKKDEFGGIVDFKNVDDQVGTITEFSDAMRKLKNAGLMILMTLVPNHSSTKHEWFVDPEHQFHDYYVRKPEGEFGIPYNNITNDGLRSITYLNEFVIAQMTKIKLIILDFQVAIYVKIIIH